jgi:hypothetical protein
MLMADAVSGGHLILVIWIPLVSDVRGRGQLG